MALDSGPLPVAIPTSVARTDFNNAMNQLNAAFPLNTPNIGDEKVTLPKLLIRSVTINIPYEAANITTDPDPDLVGGLILGWRPAIPPGGDFGYLVELYLTPNGEIFIRQRNPSGPGGKNYVVVVMRAV